jgi:hypothetical protein
MPKRKLSAMTQNQNRENQEHINRRYLNMLVNVFSGRRQPTPGDTKESLKKQLIALLKLETEKQISRSQKERLLSAFRQGPFSILNKESFNALIRDPMTRKNQNALNKALDPNAVVRTLPVVPYPIINSAKARQPTYDHHMLMLHDLITKAAEMKMHPWRKSHELWKHVQKMPSFYAIERLLGHSSDAEAQSQLHKLLMTPSLFITQPIMVNVYIRALKKAHSMHPIHLAKILAMTHYAYTNHRMYFGHTRHVYINNPAVNRPLFAAVLNVLRTKRPIPDNTELVFSSKFTHNRTRVTTTFNSNNRDFIGHLMNQAEIARKRIQEGFAPNVPRNNMQYIDASEITNNMHNHKRNYTIYRLNFPLTIRQKRDAKHTETDERWVFQSVACEILSTAFVTDFKELYDDTYLEVAQVFSSLCPEFAGKIYASFTYNGGHSTFDDQVTTGQVLANFFNKILQAQQHLRSYLISTRTNRNRPEPNERLQMNLFSHDIIRWMFYKAVYIKYVQVADYLLQIDPNLDSFKDMELMKFCESWELLDHTGDSRLTHFLTISNRARKGMLPRDLTMVAFDMQAMCLTHFSRRYPNTAIPLDGMYLPSKDYFLPIATVISSIIMLDPDSVQWRTHNMLYRYVNNTNENNNTIPYQYEYNLYYKIRDLLNLLQPFEKTDRPQYLRYLLLAKKARSGGYSNDIVANVIPGVYIPKAIRVIAKVFNAFLHHKFEECKRKVCRIVTPNGNFNKFPRKTHIILSDIATHILRIYRKFKM